MSSISQVYKKMLLHLLACLFATRVAAAPIELTTMTFQPAMVKNVLSAVRVSFVASSSFLRRRFHFSLFLSFNI